MRKLFGSMVGATLVRVEGLENDSGEVRFYADDGRVWTLFHDQDCCEVVRVADVEGDLNALIGKPVLVAEEVSNADGPDPSTDADRQNDSYTWTFYKIATVRGHVDIRWLGESNGYYSERVSCKLYDPNTNKEEVEGFSLFD